MGIPARGTYDLEEQAVPDALTYTVDGMTCAHCKTAVTNGLLAVAGVVDVDVDLSSKRVVAKGTDLDDEELRAAIVEAGYEAA